MANVLALIGKPKPPGKGGAPSLDDEPDGDEMTPPGEPSMEDAKMTAAEDALAAFDSGDASALSDALTRHYDACAMGKPY